jgi:hypothetical protein
MKMGEAKRTSLAIFFYYVMHCPSFDIHDLSSMAVSAIFPLSVDHSSVNKSEHALRLLAAQQVERCYANLSTLSDLPGLPLNILPSPFGAVIHSICTDTLSAYCITSIHSKGLRVIKLFDGMVSGLDYLLHDGISILQCLYCDVSTQARVLAHYRLSQLTAQYPDQLSLEAWSCAFTALPENV